MMKTNTPQRGLGQKRRPMWRNAVRWAAVAAVGFVLWRAGDILLWRNLGTITAGQAYRSNQLSGTGFRAEITALKLRSVINLCGANPGEEWYRDETAVCARAGVTHYDVRMSAIRLPNPDTLALLARTLREAQRPVLIHCKQGADRTGLATALFLMLTEGLSPSEAGRRGLTLWHGHLPVGRTTAMNRVLRMYQETGQGMEFEQWVANIYPGMWMGETEAKKP